MDVKDIAEYGSDETVSSGRGNNIQFSQRKNPELCNVSMQIKAREKESIGRGQEGGSLHLVNIPDP